MYVARKNVIDQISSMSKQSMFNFVERDCLNSYRPPSGNGYRASVTIIDTNTGKITESRGSWGGANMFEKSLNTEGISVDLEVGVYAVVTEEGGMHKGTRVLTVYCSAQSMPINNSELTLEGLDENTIKAFSIIRSNSGSYRNQYFTRAKLGAYGIDNPHVKILMEKGLLKKAGQGIAVVAEARDLKAPEPDYMNMY